jgi:dTDP-4-amino-4,6-dideoxygalactose transaminase
MAAVDLAPRSIPFVDLSGQYRDIRGEVLAAVEDVMRGARFILGEEVQRFEQEFAAYCGADHCVGVANGTDALHLALRALEIGPGDEVITAANTFIATAVAVKSVGATPVFVDVSPRDFNLDVEHLKAAITPNTRAVIPVHLYGQPADMDAVLRIAEEHGLKVVEDACQAHGARYRDRPVGSFGHAACFSFYPGKNLGAYGDGGAVVTSDADLAERIKLLRNYGQKQKNEFSLLGFNSRLDTVQAAVLLVKLKYLDRWNEVRRSLAAVYREELADAGVALPQEMPDRRHVYHLFVIQQPRRNELLAHLQHDGVHCGIHYPSPAPHTPPFRHARCVPDGVPVSAGLSQRILSLPMCPQLTREQVFRVAEAIRSLEP